MHVRRKLVQKLIGSMLGASMQHVRTIFQADEEHVGAKLSAYLVVHVSRFLGKVCKHIGSFLK